MSLEDIREKKQSKGLYVVIGLLLLGMAGFGTSRFGTGSGSSPQVLLHSDNTEVTMYEYEDALRAVQKNNPQLDPAQARKVALLGLKERIALRDYIDTYPFAASNKQIDKAITSNLAFYDNGKFSEERFRQVVRVAPEAYRRGLSKSIAMSEFQNAIVMTSVVSNAEVQPYMDMQNLSRDITVAKIPATSVTATAKPEEVQKYYDEHTSEFMTDEQFDITYIDFNPADIAETVEVDDAQVLAELKPPREASYYLFKDEASAKAAYDKIAAGETMQSLKTTMANAIEDSDSLGELARTAGEGTLIPQNAIDAIFALDNVGDVTAPLTVDGSVYLFELTNKPDLAVTEQSKARAKKKLQAKLAAPLIAEASEKLNNAVFEKGAPTLQSIKDATGLSIQQSGLVNSTSKQGLLALPEMAAALSKSEKVTGKFQEPVTIGDRVIMYQFAEVKKPKQKSFDEVKAQAEQGVIAEKKAQQLAEAAQQLQAQATQKGLVPAAQEKDYATQTYTHFDGNVEQGGALDKFAALLILKETPKVGKANATVVSSPLGDSYVYVTDAVSLGKKANDGAIEKQLVGQLSVRTGVAQLNTFLQSITERSQIVDNSARLLEQQ